MVTASAALGARDGRWADIEYSPRLEVWARRYGVYIEDWRMESGSEDFAGNLLSLMPDSS